MGQALLIVNPHATGYSHNLAKHAAKALSGIHVVELAQTRAPGHAIELAREARRQGLDLVLACGGDGTVNEAANGLLGASPEAHLPADDLCAGVRMPALACVPAGQANVFARMLGIPARPLTAVDYVAQLARTRRSRKVDVGIVNGRCFTFASGIGLDAIVTREVDARPRLKARFRSWFYAWTMMSVLAGRYLTRAPRMSVLVRQRDGLTHSTRTLRGMTTVIQNGTPFTYFRERPIEVARGGRLDSGTLVGAVLCGARGFDLPSLALRALSPRLSMAGHHAVSAFSDALELNIESIDGAPLPVHVDGDYLGEHASASYAVLGGALEVIA